MKKLLLLFAVLFSTVSFAQKIDLEKFNQKSKLLVKNVIKLENENLIDFKIDSVKTEKLTKRSAITESLVFMSTKSRQNREKIQIQINKAKYLPVSERFKKIDSLYNIINKNNTNEKESTLLKKYDTADNKKLYVIMTKVSCYVKLEDDEQNGNYDYYFFYKPNGELIKDIYQYIILE